MPKQKNSSAAKKRFVVMPSGRVKRAKQNKRHILTKKEMKLLKNVNLHKLIPFQNVKRKLADWLNNILSEVTTILWLC